VATVYGTVLAGITRVSVIDHRRVDPVDNNGFPVRGLVIEARGSRISIDVQDDGRTLKVWITDPPGRKG
jgi:hypothetical protein